MVLHEVCCGGLSGDDKGRSTGISQKYSHKHNLGLTKCVHDHFGTELTLLYSQHGTLLRSS